MEMPATKPKIAVPTARMMLELLIPTAIAPFFFVLDPLLLALPVASEDPGAPDVNVPGAASTRQKASTIVIHDTPKIRTGSRG